MLEPPPEPGPSLPAKILPPEIAGVSISRWAHALEPAPDPSVRYAGLKETVRQLREQHRQDRQQTREQLKRIRTAPVRMLAPQADLRGCPQEAATSIIMITPETSAVAVAPSGTNVTRHWNGLAPAVGRVEHRFLARRSTGQGVAGSGDAASPPEGPMSSDDQMLVLGFPGREPP